MIRIARFLAAVCTLCGVALAQDAAENVPENPFPNRVPAVELDGGSEWFNTANPIRLKDLRGKVVLLDFWTYCCINCMHVLPDLHALEQKFPNELVVIGVHSAKFDNEKQSDNIRQAIMRYEIAHPVVNDDKMTIWRKFQVRAWPTLVLLDPEGQYCGYVSGEGNREILEQVIGKVIAYHRAKKTLDESPVHFSLERDKQPATPLRYPGKLAVDAAQSRVFISDSNHHRIVVADREGKLIDVIGRGSIGSTDGSYAEAEFDRPQGLCLVGDTLFVADTENHLIRAVNVTTKTVRTLAGTGEQARGRSSGGVLRETELNSPWDVCHVDGVLYVAMAGPHQIWSHALGSGSIQVFAGSGREDIRNGDLDEAALAQPSGIVSDGAALYVVDSEGSSVRKISLGKAKELASPKGTVATVVGASDLPNGRALFEFGDEDGAADDVRLQHPLGLLVDGGQLLVADSYNHKIKQVDLKSRKATTWLGTGKPGRGLDPLELSEPAGLVLLGDDVLIADTNNHRIVAVNRKTKAARKWDVQGLQPPIIAPATDPAEAPLRTLARPETRVKSGGTLAVTIDVVPPEGHKVNRAAPLSWRLVDGRGLTVAESGAGKKQKAVLDGDRVRLELKFQDEPGDGELLLQLTYGYCTDDESLCKMDVVRWKLPVVVGTNGQGELALSTRTE